MTGKLVKRRVRKTPDARALDAVAKHLPVLVQPAITATLEAAKRVMATELAYMEKDAQDGKRLELGDAKKIQALVQSLQTTQQLEKAAQEEDLGDQSEAELDAAFEAAVAEEVRKRLGRD